MTTKEYLEHQNDKSYEHECKQYNRNLCEKYQWIIPMNAFSGKRITDCSGEEGEEGFWPSQPEKHPDYDYECTIMDCMPDGWRIAFGDQFCKEMQEELVKHNFVDKLQVVQVKEKYGELRFYTNGCPESCQEVIDKYSRLSERICIDCGAPATRITVGWIFPYCDNCVTKTNLNSIPIEEAFK